MYLLQQIFTVILSLFGIASLRILIRHYVPNIKEWHLDVILGSLLVIVLIINWKIHDEDTKQILQLQSRIEPRSLNSTQELIAALSTEPRGPVYFIIEHSDTETLEYGHR